MGENIKPNQDRDSTPKIFNNINTTYTMKSMNIMKKAVISDNIFILLSTYCVYYCFKSRCYISMLQHIRSLPYILSANFGVYFKNVDSSGSSNLD